MKKIKLGLAPTRRAIFSAPAAMEYAEKTRSRLKELGVEYVDINDISEDGLLHDEEDEIRIAEKFRAAGVSGLFLPHTNFGTEYEPEWNAPARFTVRLICDRQSPSPV